MSINQRVTITEEEKKALFVCYKLMVDYVNSDNVESEECFCEMSEAVREQKKNLPEDLFAEIEKFVDTELSALVYDEDPLDGLNREDYEVGEGCITCKTEQATLNMCKKFAEQHDELVKKMERFESEFFGRFFELE